ncbi:hypothetical protein F4804DRAFT_313742 [Jackrogersella minutella]|nr:hypothetical protein F4804DRAFT_313742 [Jackrogersella minutella]
MFPQFTKLPLELRFMIWEFAIPRRGISLIDEWERDPTQLPKPAIAVVCKEAQQAVERRRRRPIPSIGGWFDRKMDICIWEYHVEVMRWKIEWFERQVPFFKQLHSLTLVESRSADWLWNAGPYGDDGGDDNLFKRYDKKKDSHNFHPIEYVFNWILEGDCKIRTINIFNHLNPTSHSFKDSFILEESGRLPSLFGNDDIILVDHTDSEEVYRVADILETQWKADVCSEKLTWFHDSTPEEYQPYHWNSLMARYKVVWLTLLQKRGEVKGLPSTTPAIVGVDTNKKTMVLNWNEDDPIIKRCLKKMPEIHFVFVIMADDRIWSKNHLNRFLYPFLYELDD